MDTILPGILLTAGNQLVSSTSESNHSMGNFRIAMQIDGNVVLYPIGSPNTGNYAYWATNTSSFGKNVKLTLDGNGRLYMLNSSGVNAKNITPGATHSGGKAYRATIDADGIFRLYSDNLSESGNWSIEWAVPGDVCGPKGICGMNGFCDIQNQQFVCICPPGFVFINQEQKDLGCNRSFTTESCDFKTNQTKYIIQEMQNTVIEQRTYAFLSPTTNEECKQACLEDCNCDAAFFQGQECMKQKLPLTFGRFTGDSSTSTFVKVGIDLGGNGFGAPNINPIKRTKVLRVDILIIGVACVAFSVILLAFSALLMRYRIWRNYQPRERSVEDVSLRAFTYTELEVATNCFTEEVGRGSFGTVFKGTLSNGQRTIAVKRLESNG